MKEILEAIDNLRTECPAFLAIIVEVSSNGTNGHDYMIKLDAYHPDVDRSFCVRLPFTKVKEAHKAIENMMIKTMCAYNDLDEL
jgi:hypothetical protein